MTFIDQKEAGKHGMYKGISASFHKQLRSRLVVLEVY